MSSSDSDDEFSAKKLRLAREQCRKMLESKITQEDSSVKKTGKNYQAQTSNSVANLDNTVNTSENVENLNKSNSDSFIDSVEQDMLIDEIIKKNTAPARGRGRGRGRKKKEPALKSARIPEIPTPTSGRSRGGRRGRASRNSVSSINEINKDIDEMELLNTTCRRGRSRGNKSIIDTLLSSMLTQNQRGRGRKRSIHSCSPNSSLDEVLEEFWSGNVSRRGRGRGRARQRGTGRGQIMPPPQVQNFNVYPTYSVGNIDEYPDNSDDIPLFSKNHTNNVLTNVTDDVVVLDNETEDLDDELFSVKVIWKSIDIFKFSIRKYQKLSQIFDTFAQKENVDKDKLLFTYNNKILSCDDTPASIDYSVAKFIDGGVVSHSLKRVIKEKSIVNGIQIKFQCQNTKKPLEITIGKDDKVSLAFTQCAEHLKLPLEKLKFEFDGDSVTDTETPQQLGLENGDCIDVMILN